MSPLSDKTFEVRAGADVVLRGKTDKRLQSMADGGVKLLPPARGAAEVKADLELIEEGTEQFFQLTFHDVRTLQDFTLEFTDTDNVKSLRQFIMKCKDDLPPEVDVQVDGIRKTLQGYLCTVEAPIPITGVVRDDHGLELVEFVYILAKLENQSEQSRKLLQLIGAMSLLAGGPGYDLLAAGVVMPLVSDASQKRSTNHGQPKPVAGDPEGGVAKPVPGWERLAVPSFTSALRSSSWEQPLPRAELLELLKKPYDKKGRRDLLKAFDFKPGDDRASFDLRNLRLKVREVSELQPRYRMQLWIEATDNNIESGPRRNQVKERLTFLLVSQYELLAEMAKDEEEEYKKLREDSQPPARKRKQAEQGQPGPGRHSAAGTGQHHEPRSGAVRADPGEVRPRRRRRARRLCASDPGNEAQSRR